jgi:hypothetical protein
VGAFLAGCGDSGLLASDPQAPSQERAGTLRIANGLPRESPVGPLGLV